MEFVSQRLVTACWLHKYFARSAYLGQSNRKESRTHIPRGRRCLCTNRWKLSLSRLICGWDAICCSIYWPHWGRVDHRTMWWTFCQRVAQPKCLQQGQRWNTITKSRLFHGLAWNPVGSTAWWGVPIMPHIMETLPLASSYYTQDHQVLLPP